MKGAKKPREDVRRDAIADSCPAGWAKRVTFLESATIKMQCASPFLATSFIILPTRFK